MRHCSDSFKVLSQSKEVADEKTAGIRWRKWKRQDDTYRRTGQKVPR